MTRHPLQRPAASAVLVGSLLFVLVAAISTARAEEPEPAPLPEDLSNLSLEDLMNIEVTSVSRQKQKVSEAPAAVSVITQEDIRRSGMTFIPELLRLAPGVTVARADANDWAISSRGFLDLFSNKLLVLFDGRTVYTPLFSGVYWNNVDYVLADLERIEVIRGPGATLWGANAVNGVISITTKSARDTQGWLFSGHGSTDEGIGAVRYGSQLDDQTYYRVYAKYRDHHDFLTADDRQADDGWDMLRGGFRIDRYASDKDILTLQGDIYNGDLGQTLDLPSFLPPFSTAVKDTLDSYGGNVLGRWTHIISPTSDFSLQLYYDRVVRNDLQADHKQDTLDVDFQHRFALGQRQEIIWGAGYRYLSDNLGNSEFIVFDPSSRDDYLWSAFIQDNIALAPDRLHLFLGSKFEINNYTGLEIQPSARLLWTPDEKNSVWGAVSRAVRTPSRFEDDVTIIFATMPGTPFPMSVDVTGDHEFESEDLLAYELGYRVQPTRAITLDIAAFYNVYDDLRDVTPGAPFFDPTPTPHIVIPATVDNELEGFTYGTEIAANWMVTDNWRLAGSYTWFHMRLHRSASTPSLDDIDDIEDADPSHQFQIRSYYNITRNMEVNAAVYFVDSLDGYDVPSYTRVDANFVWRPKDNMEVMVGVRNLLDDRHPEFTTRLNDRATEIPLSVFGQLTLRF